MAGLTLKASIPDMPLRPGMILKLEAISPTTGLAITGVTSSRWSIYGRDSSPADGGLDGPTTLPEWVPGDDQERL